VTKVSWPRPLKGEFNRRNNRPNRGREKRKDGGENRSSVSQKRVASRTSIVATKISKKKRSGVGTCLFRGEKGRAARRSGGKNGVQKGNNFLGCVQGGEPRTEGKSDKEGPVRSEKKGSVKKGADERGHVLADIGSDGMSGKSGDGRIAEARKGGAKATWLGLMQKVTYPHNTKTEK